MRTGAVSAVAVLERYIDRIQSANPDINAFTHLNLESARAVARSIDELVGHGADPGPLAGVPLGVKDTEDCIGMPTWHGSTLYRDRPVARADSALVARARAAGAVPVGKTAVPELALHAITSSPVSGTTRNPWDPALTPGGSSGGSSAAVSSGMVPLGTATDAGGSTRSPAAFTGLVGLKPSHGRISQQVASDLLDVGCVSLTVRDTARFLDVCSGPHSADRTALPQADQRYEDLIERLDVRGLRAAWSDDLGFVPTEPECIEVARRAAEALAQAAGLRWIDRRFVIPNPRLAWVAAYVVPLRAELELDGIWPDRAGEMTQRARARLSEVDDYRPADLARAARLRLDVERTSGAFFEGVDILFTPTTAVVSLPAEGPIPEEIAGRDARATGPEAHLTLANLTWQPAISVPAGPSRTGLPIGLQIVGRRGRDDCVLRLARILEQVNPWPLHAPAYRSR
ncbi:MAG: amidase [Gemmatimonadota bacterium]